MCHPRERISRLPCDRWRTGGATGECAHHNRGPIARRIQPATTHDPERAVADECAGRCSRARWRRRGVMLVQGARCAHPDSPRNTPDCAVLRADSRDSSDGGELGRAATSRVLVRSRRAKGATEGPRWLDAVGRSVTVSDGAFCNFPRERDRTRPMPISRPRKEGGPSMHGRLLRAGVSLPYLGAH